MSASADALRLLQPWPRFAEQYWWDDPARPDLGCFGTGYNSWGVQTNQKYLSALAVLAAASDLDEAALGLSRAHLRERALRALRFSLASHVSGDHHCSDGTQWGHTWISGLGIERMMHGVAALEPFFTATDHAALRRLLCSEADALLELPVLGTLWARDGGNHPESNLWNGALLWRVATMYPDAPQAEQWRARGTLSLLNSISVPADAEADTLVAGKRIADWHVGPNFFPHYALDHHGYLNVGYMVICLSQVAFLHFACREHGWEAPGELYHHAAELWALVRRLIFSDGRLARLGGDSRQRYCYCQDYLLPTLLWAQDWLGDDYAANLETGQLATIGRETAYNADGSYLSRRLATIRESNPYYYTRLESDKACALGMNLYWRRVLGLGEAVRRQAGPADLDGAWEEPEHGAMLQRSRRRLVSWSWRAWDPPQGLCLPPDDGQLAEWCANLGGEVRLAGEQGRRTVLEHAQTLLPGGFLTTGVMADSGKACFAEGWTGSDPVRHAYAVAALPDDRTLLVMERCQVQHRTFLTAVKGLKLNVPNDLFNEGRRRYFAAAGETVVEGTAQGLTELVGRWVNVEDRLGVVGLYGADNWLLYQAGHRRASGYDASLYYDELCCPGRVGLWSEDPGTVVLDCASAVLSGADRVETAALLASGCRVLATDGTVRAVAVRGADGRGYVLAANLGPEATACALDLGPEPLTMLASLEASSLVPAGDGWRLELPPGGALLAGTL